PIAIDWIGVFDPAAHIEVVDVLFADLVAGEPVEVVPVVALVSHLGDGLTWRHEGLCLIASLVPNSSAVPVDAECDDIADGAVMQSLDSFDVLWFVASL